MSGNGRKEASLTQEEVPKRSLISYICPCFNFASNRNHTLKGADKLPMNHTEESNSTLPFDRTKPKQSLTEAQPNTTHDPLDPLHEALKQNEQSGIYISFKENESDKEEKSQYAQMEEDYERYLRQSKPKNRPYPINNLRESRLIVVGNHQAKILCKVKSVHIEPSAQARKKQEQAQRHKEKCSDPVIEKFWDKRYTLFQKFDEGIKLDQQSWFSVTPEAVAEHIASRLSSCDSVLDGFCGAGGDSIKLALNCNRVVSNDIDPRKIKLLENNAAVYGVDNIQTMASDFFMLDFKRNEFEAVYMSPPWGGPEYHKLNSMMPKDFIPPLDQIISKSLTLSDNVVLLLPKNTDIQSIPALIFNSFEKQHILGTCSMHLEKIFFEGKFKFIILYVGSRVSRISLSDELEYIYRMLGEGREVFRHKRVVKKVRQEIGMLKLLNFIFRCERENSSAPLYQRLSAYLIENQIISKDKIAKLEEVDEEDAIRHKQSKQQKKIEKIMVKSQRFSHKPHENSNITATYNGARASLESPPKREKLDQTVSYVSSISESKMPSSIEANHAINHSIDKSGVKIEELVQSKIIKE